MILHCFTLAAAISLMKSTVVESNASVMKGKVKGEVKREVSHLFFATPFNCGKRDQVVAATSVECLKLTEISWTQCKPIVAYRKNLTWNSPLRRVMKLLGMQKMQKGTRFWYNFVPTWGSRRWGSSWWIVWSLEGRV